MSKLYTAAMMEQMFYEGFTLAQAIEHLGPQERALYDSLYIYTEFERLLSQLGLSQDRPRVPQTKKGRFRE